jgi:hypothetical protein
LYSSDRFGQMKCLQIRHFDFLLVFMGEMYIAVIG